MKKTPISIISGYLGAGKTTLLKKIIKNLDRKFAILMNEFGEIDIDAKVIKGKNINITELTGGCVCCSLTGEFEEAIKEIIAKYNPEIIIVETTGVAEPDAIVFDISESLPNVKLDSIITIVDADALIRFPDIGEIGKIQIEMADILLLNKIDLVNKRQLKEVKEKIKKINKRAQVFETKHCTVDIDILFSIEFEHHIKKIHHKHETLIKSFTYTFTKSINKNLFKQFLKNLPQNIYRLKGFVAFKNKTYLLNYVAGRWDLKLSKSNKLDLVFIGENIDKVKNKIINELNKL